jgi:hypothetical protein
MAGKAVISLSTGLEDPEKVCAGHSWHEAGRGSMPGV